MSRETITVGTRFRTCFCADEIEISEIRMINYSSKDFEAYIYFKGAPDGLFPVQLTMKMMSKLIHLSMMEAMGGGGYEYEADD